MTKFLELFICPVQDKIVRGTDVIYLPDAENPEKLSGRCPLCNAAIEKPVIYIEKNAKVPRPTQIIAKSAPSAAERKAEQIKPDEKVYRLVSPPQSRESKEIQRKIEEKEARYEKYLDDLAENDPEAIGEKNLDIYDVAALISKEELAEFEALIKKRNELMARPTFEEVK
jgi:hypothetical protein